VLVQNSTANIQQIFDLSKEMIKKLIFFCYFGRFFVNGYEKSQYISFSGAKVLLFCDVTK
jgi:hypothetical protein